MDDTVDHDRLKDMICDVGAESFVEVIEIKKKYVSRCGEFIVSWIN